MYNYLKRLNGREHQGILSPNATSGPLIMSTLAVPSKSRYPDENGKNLGASNTF